MDEELDSSMDDFMSLKRANPVYDSDSGEEDEYESPTKRVRAFMNDDIRDDELSQTTRSQTLEWKDLLAEDETQGYNLFRLIR